jgi:hypothetical protein
MTRGDSRPTSRAAAISARKALTRRPMMRMKMVAIPRPSRSRG